MSNDNDIPISNEIQQFMHCALCIMEKPSGVSPRHWSQIECGWTPIGFQVWCKRHEANICHVDFEGQTHPANLNRIPRPGERKPS